MANFEYRTFLLPQLLLKLGAFAALNPDRDYLGNNFMQGEITPENVNQLINAIHQTAVLLNLAGYQLEAMALAAKDDDVSAGVYVNFIKGEYTTHTANTSDAKNALQYLISKNFTDGDDLCFALRLTPRPRVWLSGPEEQYYALRIPLDNVNVFEDALELTRPYWLLLGGVASGFPAVVGIHHILMALSSILDDLRAAVASALADEWDSKPSEQRGGLLPYLNPANWGDPIVGMQDDLSSQHTIVYSTAATVYNWLEAIDKATFQEWLLTTLRGSFKETLRVAQAGLANKKSVADFESAVTTVFIKVNSFRAWVRYKHVWDVVGLLHQGSETTLYLNVLMVLEEIGVIDLLGRERQTDSSIKSLLPFDITGHYEQVPPPDTPESDENTYDYHTLQINQAGEYAQGFWQERVTANCADTYNGGRYMRFNHYRFCFDKLPQQTYDAGQTEFFMQVYRWGNTNFLSAKPYLKLSRDAKEEAYCNKTSSDVLSIRIAKIDVLPVDALVPDSDLYAVPTPGYGVELEIDIGGETFFFKRLNLNAYVAQADLIEAPDAYRENLVLAQRFPLHSMDKVRAAAAARYLIEGLEAEHDAFSTRSHIENPSSTHTALEQIDHDFAEWMARYICVVVDETGTVRSRRAGPQFEMIRTFIVNMLGAANILNDTGLEALTLLTVFLARPIHDDLMPYTRSILKSGLPARTDAMDEAVDNNTAGLHVYKWGTDGLGETGQSTLYEIAYNVAKKALENVKKITDVLVQIEKNILPVLGIEAAIFVLDIEKITPFTDPNNNAYPGWLPGEKHHYLGVQVGLSVSPPTPNGIFLKADSTQLMYSSVNWDPGDFTGRFNTWSLSAGAVFDTTSMSLLGVDINSWVEGWLQNSTPVQMLGEFLEFDPQNLKLGLGLSATIFHGNKLDGQRRDPIISKGMNWIDYSAGVAYILEAASLGGYIIHIPEFIAGSQAKNNIAQDLVTPIDPITWRVIDSNPPYQIYHDIDEWELEDTVKSDLRQFVAEYLTCFRNRATRLTINGHASPVGEVSYNLWLSQKRAQTVYDYIRSILSDDEYAILPHNTTIQGYGELYPTLLGAGEYATEWQTVQIFINGHLVMQVGERISEQDTGGNQ